MSLKIALALALAAGSAPEPPLCPGLERRTEPDMRILESDLQRAEALDAVEQLRSMIERGQLSGDSYFAVLNQLKFLEGHVLIQQAKSERQAFGPDSTQTRESTRALCDWLVENGFWFD